MPLRFTENITIFLRYNNIMKRKRNKTYKEVFGVSKKELFKACAKHARYNVLARLICRSYTSAKKWNIERVKTQFNICAKGALPWWMPEDTKRFFILNFKREKYYLDQDCLEIIAFAELSNEEVKKRAIETIERNKDFPF